jgi:hypothetical protein
MANLILLVPQSGHVTETVQKDRILVTLKVHRPVIISARAVPSHLSSGSLFRLNNVSWRLAYPCGSLPFRCGAELVRLHR